MDTVAPLTDGQGSELSGTTVKPGAEAPAGGSAARSRLAAAWRDPTTVVIAAATVLALGLRVYELSLPGYLFGLTEYDDGSYFGSAVHLVGGILPYRDFVFVQPPGILLLMAPAALVAQGDRHRRRAWPIGPGPHHAGQRGRRGPGRPAGAPPWRAGRR